MNKKRIAQYILSLTIAASVSAYSAACPFSIVSEPGIVTAAQTNQGNCGPEALFSLSDDGILTISGKGPMNTDMSSPLWDASAVKKVIIESGITSIGNCAFANHANLASVTISDTVTTVGNSAFMNCTALTDVNFGTEILTINSEAFSHCTSLPSVVLKQKVQTISDKAFYSCYSLKSITIPASVTSIGTDALLYCGTGEPTAQNTAKYNFTAYTAKDSYAAGYIASLKNTASQPADPPEEISAFDYYDIVCVALGNDIYYKIVDSKDYVPSGEVRTYYIPGLNSKIGDIYGIELKEDNKETSYSESPQILQNSSFDSKQLYTIEDHKYADAEGSFVFGTVDAVLSNTCVQISTDSERLLIICDSTAGLSQGVSVAFTPYEIISGNNMPVYTTKNLVKTYYTKGICLGYSAQLRCSLFMGTSSGYSKIPSDKVSFFFVAGTELPVGQQAFGAYFTEPDKFINDIPVLTLYNGSAAKDAPIIKPVDDGTGETVQGMLSVKYTDNGGLVFLDKDTSVYILNDIPADADPGDMLSFRLLNKAEDGAYYAADVKKTGQTGLATEPGDINKDKRVDILDLILLKSYALQDLDKVDGVCDVNGDTYFTVADIVALVNILLNK